MALVPCPECKRQISSEAAACPGCGHPTVEYWSHRVTESSRGNSSGQETLSRLLSEGWKIVSKKDETEKSWGKEEGSRERIRVEIYITYYKLSRSLLNRG